MVRTVKEVIEDKAKTKTERYREHHDSHDLTGSFLAYTFLRWIGRYNIIQETTPQSPHEPGFAILDQLLKRKSETQRQNSRKIDSLFIPGIWLGRATESDGHDVGTAEWVFNDQERDSQASDIGQRLVGRTQESSGTLGMRWVRPQNVRRTQETHVWQGQSHNPNARHTIQTQKYNMTLWQPRPVPHFMHQ